MRAFTATVVNGSTLPIARSRTGTLFGPTGATLTGTAVAAFGMRRAGTGRETKCDGRRARDQQQAGEGDEACGGKRTSC